MEYKCPECGSIIYSRRNILCGVCGKQLPPELLFTPEEKEKFDRQLAEDKKRRQKEAEKESGSGGPDTVIGRWHF
jgi:uncharacterized Zn finger protein (UPF0148 family)